AWLRRARRSRPRSRHWPRGWPSLSRGCAFAEGRHTPLVQGTVGDEPEAPVGLPRPELELDQEMLGRERPGRPIRPLDRDDAGRVKDLLEAEPLKIRRLEPVEIDVRERHRPPVLVDEGERGAAHGAGHPEAAGEPLHEAGLPRSRGAGSPGAAARPGTGEA